MKYLIRIDGGDGENFQEDTITVSARTRREAEKKAFAVAYDRWPTESCHGVEIVDAANGVA